MGIIEKDNVERERQLVALIRSMERAKHMIESMEYIGEMESDRIQEFIAYNIPRCNIFFTERHQFRSILKALSYGKVNKLQAIESLLNLKFTLIELNTILEGVQ